jgi:hypothetical protein
VLTSDSPTGLPSSASPDSNRANGAFGVPLIEIVNGVTRFMCATALLSALVVPLIVSVGF